MICSTGSALLSGERVQRDPALRWWPPFLAGPPTGRGVSEGLGLSPTRSEPASKIPIHREACRRSGWVGRRLVVSHTCIDRSHSPRRVGAFVGECRGAEPLCPESEAVPQKNTLRVCPVEDPDFIGESIEGAGGWEQEPWMSPVTNDYSKPAHLECRRDEFLRRILLTRRITTYVATAAALAYRTA